MDRSHADGRRDRSPALVDDEVHADDGHELERLARVQHHLAAGAERRGETTQLVARGERDRRLGDHHRDLAAVTMRDDGGLRHGEHGARRRPERRDPSARDRDEARLRHDRVDERLALARRVALDRRRSFEPAPHVRARLARRIEVDEQRAVRRRVRTRIVRDQPEHATVVHGAVS